MSVAANVGTMPTAGLLVPSRRVIVTVEVALPFAVTDPVPVMEEFTAETEPLVKVTVFVTEVNPLGVVMLRVLVWATVAAIVPVATPDAFVTAPGWVSVFPLPVDPNAVVTPFTGLLFASRSVIVTVEVVAPSAVTPLEGEAEIVELATTGLPATNVAVVVTPENPAGVAMLKVFVCATVDAIVPVATPEALVTAAGWVRVFPVPVDAKEVETPLAGFPFASIRVIVTVDVATPSAVIPVLGEAEMVEFPAAGAPAIKVTVPLTPPKPVGEEMLIVFVAATVDAMVPVVCPELLVAAPGWPRVFPLPVAERARLTPLTGLL